MITKQVIQTCIDELKELTKVDFCVIDVQGVMMASTFQKNSLDITHMKSFFDSPADSQIIGGNYLFKVKEDGEVIYILISRATWSLRLLPVCNCFPIPCNRSINTVSIFI